MGIRTGKAVWEAETEGIELLDITIGDLLERQAEAFPDREALVYNYPEIGLDLRMSYSQYRSEAGRLAKGLMAMGIERGDHVAVWATNVPEWPLLEMALAKIGAVMVTVNTNYRAAELEYVLHQGDVNALVMIAEYRDNSFLDAINAVAPELKRLGDPAREELECARLPRLKRVVLIGDKPAPGLLPYSQLLAMGERVSDRELQNRQTSVGPRDPSIHQRHYRFPQRRDANSPRAGQQRASLHGAMRAAIGGPDGHGHALLSHRRLRAERAGSAGQRRDAHSAHRLRSRKRA
jgi:fatty-acyl-CoA synthase